MRLILDTNILISAPLQTTSLPAHLVSQWRARLFELLTSSDQLDEVKRVTRSSKLREHVRPAEAGLLINELRRRAIDLKVLPKVDVSRAVNDNYLLAMASVGQADFLVTGDKRDLVSLKLYGRTRIVTVREFLTMHGGLP